jgi:hypothetical protein
LHEERGESVTTKVLFAPELSIKGVKICNILEDTDEESIKESKADHTFNEETGELIVTLKAFRIVSF